MKVRLIFFMHVRLQKAGLFANNTPQKTQSLTRNVNPLVDIHRVEDYCEWMAGFAGVTAPGGSYDLHSASYDEESRTALFFATYHARHTGEGGPVPPTQKQTHSHYVMAMTMNKDNKVEKMIKIWNAPWAMKELGWM